MVDHSPPLPSITLCVGAVVMREGKVLFIRQAYGKLKGKWSLPWGFVDGWTPDGSLETPDRAAVRETLLLLSSQFSFSHTAGSDKSESPYRIARTAAWVRSVTPSFSKIELT